MIRHVVALSLSDPAGRDLAAVMDGLAALVGAIPGFTGFAHGPNRDAEGKSPEYPYGFICDFADRAALDRYGADPRHVALGQRLVALCRGGGAGVLVFDLETS